MEEKQKPIKMKLHTFIIIIAVVVIAMMAIFMCIQKRNSNNKIKELQNEAANLQATIAELQGKLNTITGITTTSEDEDVTINQSGSSTSNSKDTAKTASPTTVKDSKSDSSSNTSSNKDNDNINEIIGTWKVDTIYDKGIEEYNYTVVFGSAGLGDGLILNKDKTFSDEIGNAISTEDTTEGTYEVNGNNVILKFSNGAVKNLKYDSQTKTLEFPDYFINCKLILKK